MAERPGKSRPVNVSTVVDLAQLKITAESKEHDEERQSRLRHDEAEATHRRRIDLLVHQVALGMLSVSGLVCLIAMILPPVPADGRKTASQVVIAIVTGVVGFAVGKAMGKAP